MLKAGAHIHLMGICGTAMASLAGLLKDQGYKVTGSDQNVYPPMSTQLEDLGIKIMEGYKASNLSLRPDLVVVGNVITRKHEEAIALLDSDIPYTSLPKAIGEYLIANRESIVVSGTHGKTTTTSILAWIASCCEKQPGFMIGGIPNNFSRSFKVPEGNWFVIEGDEYDTAFFDKVPKFIHYKPKYVVLTSIEFDHADIYDSIEDIKSAFAELVKLVPQDGLIIANGDDPLVMELVQKAQARVVTYGLQTGDYKAEDREIAVGRNQFSVRYQGQRIADIAIKLFGDHNTMNVLGSFALANELGWSQQKILQALATFEGVKRRQEIIGEPNGITIIEDFAHHPTAVRLTVQSIKEKYQGRKVFCLFEPRSATSRRKIFQKEYVDALSFGDEILVSTPYDQTRIDEAQRFSSSELISELKAAKRSAFEFSSTEAMVVHLKQKSKPGDVILIMSNGAFGGIYSQLLEGLA